MGNKLNLIGHKYGRLKPIKDAGNNEKGESRWWCLCDPELGGCGNYKIILTAHLRRKQGKTESCGCLQLDRARIDKGLAGFNILFTQYSGNARKRNIKFTLIKEEFSGITKQNCYYCGTEPLQIRTTQIGTQDGKDWAEYIYNGIDRIESSKGYTLENCVPCCKICNYMKLSLSIDEFLEHIGKVYSHTKSLLSHRLQ